MLRLFEQKMLLTDRKLNLLIVEDEDKQFAPLQINIDKIMPTLSDSTSVEITRCTHYQQALETINSGKKFAMAIFDNSIQYEPCNAANQEGQFLVAPFKKANPNSIVVAYTRDVFNGKKGEMPGADICLLTKPFLTVNGLPLKTNNKLYVGDCERLSYALTLALNNNLEAVNTSMLSPTLSLTK